MQIRLTGAIVVFFWILVAGPPASGQCTDAADFSAWLNCKVREITQARINQRGNTQQTETPSIGTNTTSLVDQSSAPDLFGVALNLAGLTSKSNEKNNTSYSMTASAYSLYAAASKHDPLDPAFYTQNRNWRRVSITLGQEFPDQTGAQPSQGGTIVGFKVLLWDKRDASDPSNTKYLKTVADGLVAASPNFNQVSLLVRNFIDLTVGPRLGLSRSPTKEEVITFEAQYFSDKDHFSIVLHLLSEQDLSAIDKIIEDHIDLEVKLADQTQSALEAIRHRPQWSSSFQTKLGKQGGTDAYKLETIFAYGALPRVDLGINASFEYRTESPTQARRRGGSFAAEGKFRLTPEARLTGAQPWVISVSGNGSWMTESRPTYQTQVKLTIPIMSGVDLPLSVTYANRTDLIKESDVKGRFGFTFDVAKLAQAFK